MPLRSVLFALVFVLLSMGTAGARNPPLLPADMHEWALASTDLVYREQFAEALEEARKITRRYPDHPAGYFFYAAALDAWMESYHSNEKETEFYRYCNLTVEKGEQLLGKRSEDPWARFFVGGGEGLKGNYEMRQQRWITAFRYGWRGVTILGRLQERYRGMHDIQYGIGSYQYWRSAMMRVLKWLPRVRDEREEGIAGLKNARENGIYTKNASAVALVEIMLHEDRYDSALAFTEVLLRVYAGNTVLLRSRAQALYHLDRFAEAERVLRIMLARAEQAQPSNSYQAMLARFWLARTYFRMERFASCIAECEGMRKLAGVVDAGNALKDMLAEIQQLQQAATREHSGHAQRPAK